MQVPVPNLQPRYGHCVAAFNVSPGITEAVLFGGSAVFPANSNNIIADTTVVGFGEYTVCLILLLIIIL